MNVIYENRHENDHYYNANWVICIALLVLSAYFLVIEFIQWHKVGIRYFSSFWNYVDLTAPIGVITVEIIQILTISDIEVDETFNRCILAITTFFMWLKFL